MPQAGTERAIRVKAHDSLEISRQLCELDAPRLREITFGQGPVDGLGVIPQRKGPLELDGRILGRPANRSVPVFNRSDGLLVAHLFAADEPIHAIAALVAAKA